MKLSVGRVGWIVSLLGVVLLPAVAHADPKDDARRHFAAGLQAAEAGQYDVALQRFLAAQEAFPHPATLYNIARTYQDLNDLPNALTYYRLYRDASPEKATDIDPVIAVIDAKLRQQGESPTTGPAPGATVVVSGGVPPEVLARLQALTAEMQARVDEVNAITSALAEGAVASVVPPDPNTPPDPNKPPDPNTSPELPIPEIQGAGLLTDAYQRVVVTASRYGQDPIDSPSAVTILTDEDIRLSGATSIADVLRRAVGVEAMSLAAGQTEISMRGLNREGNNKVLILVDGRSTYYDFFGATFLVSVPIAIEEIERIEIIRGPGSAVYGANAMNGVINIITRTPGEGGNLVHVEGGSTGYAHGSLVSSGRMKETSWRLSAGYDQTGRWAKEFSDDLSGRDYLAPDQDLALQQFRANARIDRTFLGKGFASISGGYADAFNEFYNIGALGDYFLDMRNGYLRGDVAWGDVHLRAFWNTTSGYADSWSQPADWVRSFGSALDTDVVDVELEGNRAFKTGSVSHRINAGVGYRYKRTVMPAYIPGTPTEHHQSAFFQEEATISKLKILAALRADRHPLLPLSKTLSPRGAAILRVADQTSVRLSGGTAFRAPSHIESYMEWILPASSDSAYVVDYGDKNLLPERILTGEIGFHDESSAYHTADVAVYVEQFTNLISLRSLESAASPDYQGSGDPFLDYVDESGAYVAGNTGWTNLDERYFSYGAEAQGEIFPVDGLDIYANTAIQRILKYPEGGGDPTVDRSTSLAKVNAGVTYRTPWRTDLALHGNFYSSQTWQQRTFDAAGQIVEYPGDVPAHLILSGRVGFRPLKDGSLELAAGIWNLGGALGSDTGLLRSFREHPKGQPVTSKMFGSATYKF